MSHKKLIATIIIIFILIACGYVLIEAKNKIEVTKEQVAPVMTRVFL